MNQFLSLSDSQIKLITKDKEKEPNNPISQYNYFIEIYNKPKNIIDNTYLHYLNESSIYSLIYPILKKGIGLIIISLTLLFVPIFNIFLFIIILFSFTLYHLNLNIWNKNKKIVRNPFQKLIFAEELCNSLGKVAWIFEIQMNELEGFAYNYQALLIPELQDIESKNNSLFSKMQFTVYGNKLIEYVYGFSTYKKFHTFWLFWSIFLISVSIPIFIYFWIPFVFKVLIK